MKKILLVFCACAVLASCNDGFLDRNPFDQISSTIIWNSDDNASLAVNGIYANTRLEWTFMGYPYHFTRCGPDGFEMWRNTEIEFNTATTRFNWFLNTYTQFYRLINSANEAIFNLEDNPNVSPDLAKRLTGEAKFFRAISYFILWRLYGGVIILDKPTAPMDTYLPRNSASEVKEFVIRDLTDAVELLPVAYNDADWGRITKGAAIALLGKVFLFDQQWGNAVEQFGKLLSSPYAYDLHSEYYQLFDHKWEKNNEVLFSIQFIDQSGLGSKIGTWYGMRSTHQYEDCYCFPSHHTFAIYTHADGSDIDLDTRPKRSNYDTEFNYGIDLMAWYENLLKSDIDKRLQGNIIAPTDTFIGARNETYKRYWPYEDYLTATPAPIYQDLTTNARFLWRKYLNTGLENMVREHSPNDTPIIRFADVLLMYAEALNEQSGPVAEVYQSVNRVRTRAGIVGLPEGLNKDEMRRMIWLERFKEFPGEGHLFFDVCRWRTAHTSEPFFGMNHDVLDFRGEVDFTRIFAERNYLWPIPEAERELNPNLDQNQGWD